MHRQQGAGHRGRGRRHEHQGAERPEPAWGERQQRQRAEGNGEQPAAALGHQRQAGQKRGPGQRQPAQGRRQLARARESDAGQQPERPERGVGVDVAGGLGQPRADEEAGRVGGQCHPQQLHQPEQRQRGAHQAEHRPQAPGAHGPEREQRQHDQVEAVAVGAVPGGAGLAGPRDRGVGEEGEAGEQPQRDQHQARRLPRHAEHHQGHREQREQEQRRRVPGAGEVAAARRGQHQQGDCGQQHRRDPRPLPQGRGRATQPAGRVRSVLLRDAAQAPLLARRAGDLARPRGRADPLVRVPGPVVRGALTCAASAPARAACAPAGRRR